VQRRREHRVSDGDPQGPVEIPVLSAEHPDKVTKTYPLRLADDIPLGEAGVESEQRRPRGEYDESKHPRQGHQDAINGLSASQLA